jgi:hypothetical protein
MSSRSIGFRLDDVSHQLTGKVVGVLPFIHVGVEQRKTVLAQEAPVARDASRSRSSIRAWRLDFICFSSLDVFHSSRLEGPEKPEKQLSCPLKITSKK